MVSAPTPHPHKRIHCRCKGWPHWWEFGHWLALPLDRAGITKARTAWALWKLGVLESATADCGCGEREKVLNLWGYRVAERWRWLVARWQRLRR